MGRVPSKPPKVPPEGFSVAKDQYRKQRMTEIKSEVAESERNNDYQMDLLKIGFWTGLFNP